MDCAREVLARYHGDAAAAQQVREIQEAVLFETHLTTVTWREMFRMPILRLTFLGMGVQALQQITGTNAILVRNLPRYHNLSEMPLMSCSSTTLLRSLSVEAFQMPGHGIWLSAESA
jgi:hypothetical protein